MMQGSATYEITMGAKVEKVTLYGSIPEGHVLTDAEEAVLGVFRKGAINARPIGSIGYSVDPYKAAESILAEHYGYAKMVEAHYEWEPGVVY